MYIYKTKDRHLQASEITTVFKKIRKFSDKHTLVCLCWMWECREFGRAAKFFFSSSFIWIFVFSRVAFVQCVFFSSIWFAPSEQEPKKCHLYVCHILRRCGSFFVLFGFFFLFCFARDKCEWNDEFYSYIQTHEIISIYNFFSHIILRHVQLWVPFFAVPQMFNWMADVVYQSVLFSIMLFFAMFFSSFCNTMKKQDEIQICGKKK